jgi:fumarate reductase subunit C
MGETMSAKPLVRPMSRTKWFLRQPRYLRYMAREVSCVFIGAWSFVALMALKRLSEGPAAYEAFLQALAHPLSVVFQLVTLVFALYHTTSWFNVTPKAMPVQRGEAFLPGGVIVGAHYGTWIVLSIVVLLLAGVF